MASQLNETLDSLVKIKEIVKSAEPIHPGLDDADRIEVLELSLDELRIIYARLDDSIATIRVRILTFLGAGLALLSFLYGGGDLFIPPERYGKVFYFLGLGLVIASLTFLLQAVRPNPWAVPIESKLTKLGRYTSRREMLEMMIEEYIEAMMANIVKHEKKAQQYSTGFILLLWGGILLLVIKNIGG